MKILKSKIQSKIPKKEFTIHFFSEIHMYTCILQWSNKDFFLIFVSIFLNGSK